MRIVFMGTPDFAVASLKALNDSSHEIAGVITAPDRRAGRGQKLRQSAVKEFADTKNLRVLQPTNLKDDSFIKDLKALRADLFVVVAFRMLPEVVWRMPEKGTFNLHASLLPQYRGAAPINWAIMNGETETGVTTFFIDEQIDTGAIIYQERVPIEPSENAGSLHNKLMVAGSTLVLKTVEAIAAGSVVTHTQPKPAQQKTAYKLNRDNTKIDWARPVKEIHDHIRGLSPYPVAWSNFGADGSTRQIKIYAAEVLDTGKANSDNFGTIQISDNRILIPLIDGILSLADIQLSGKKRMDVKSLLNGYTFAKGSKMF
ncbi:MAG: methionyl-tRNA formyltransferase [Leeuwenhoekiella sp.]